MRIILDTNVFISGIFFTGPPYQITKCKSCIVIQKGGLLTSAYYKEEVEKWIVGSIYKGLL